MLRSFLIYLSKAAWAQRMVMHWNVAWNAASRFVAGVEVKEAVRAIQELNEKGMTATFDHLGEHTSTLDEASQATEDILLILDEIKKNNLRSGVSIKLTQIGLELDENIARQNLIRILERAKEHKIFVRIDIEDSPYTDATIAMYEAMLAEGFTTETVGMAVQSYLYRAEEDTRKMIAKGTRLNFSSNFSSRRLISD